MRLGDLDALKEVITSNHYLLSSRNNSIDYGMFTTGIIQAIDNAPTVEPKQGKWIEGENGNIKCNQCGCEIRYSYLIGGNPDFPKFCCDCGAKMEGGAENDQ